MDNKWLVLVDKLLPGYRHFDEEGNSEQMNINTKLLNVQTERNVCKPAKETTMS